MSKCAFAEESADGHELIFSSFDPIKGRGRELCRIPFEPNRDYNWNLSPDGKYIAAAKPEENTIHTAVLAVSLLIAKMRRHNQLAF